MAGRRQQGDEALPDDTGGARDEHSHDGSLPCLL
jgi:hypothetical protein